MGSSVFFQMGKEMAQEDEEDGQEAGRKEGEEPKKTGGVECRRFGL